MHAECKFCICPWSGKEPTPSLNYVPVTPMINTYTFKYYNTDTLLCIIFQNTQQSTNYDNLQSKNNISSIWHHCFNLCLCSQLRKWTQHSGQWFSKNKPVSESICRECVRPSTAQDKVSRFYSWYARGVTQTFMCLLTKLKCHSLLTLVNKYMEPNHTQIIIK